MKLPNLISARGPNMLESHCGEKALQRASMCIEPGEGTNGCYDGGSRRNRCNRNPKPGQVFLGDLGRYKTLTS